MKRYIYTIAMLMAAAAVTAQETNLATPDADEPPLLAPMELSSAVAGSRSQRPHRPTEAEREAYMQMQEQPPMAAPPMSPGWGNWQLHSGLNLSFGASVFAQFGKHARSGAGFAQSMEAIYAVPIDNHWSLAVGGYMNRVSWSRDVFAEAGLSAVLGYRFNDHWEAYVYGQKELTNNRCAPSFANAWGNVPYALWDVARMGDRVGAAVRYTPNPSLSIQVAVEAGSRPQPEHWYRGTYNYPAPQAR